MEERWIELEGVRNARTLDGLPCADGRRVRPGLLLRTGKLAGATDADVAALSGRWRLRLVIDLRTTMERQQEPDRAVPGAERREIPVFDDRVIGVTHEKGREKFIQPPPPDMERVYRRMVFDPVCRENLGRSTLAVLEHDFSAGSVLWHCSEGKDRCGLLAMTVLAALGADRDTIMADYLLTNRFSAPKAQRTYESMRAEGEPEERAAGIRRAMRAERSFLEASFAAIDELCGGLSAYLTEGLGIPADTIRDFRARMLV